MSKPAGHMNKLAIPIVAVNVTSKLILNFLRIYTPTQWQRRYIPGLHLKKNTGLEI